MLSTAAFGGRPNRADDPFGWGSIAPANPSVSNESNVSRVLIDEDVLDIQLSKTATFFQTDKGWFGCGLQKQHQLGLGYYTPSMSYPRHIPKSEGVTSWATNGTMTLAFTPTQLLMCGQPFDEIISTLTPVVLPDGAGKVDRVICCEQYSFILCGRRCFGFGHNTHGQLGLDLGDVDIATIPTELPVPVDDIITSGDLTIIRSDDAILLCGKNDTGQLTLDPTPSVPTLTPVTLPRPVAEAAISTVTGNHLIYLRLEDGVWLAHCAPHGWTLVPDAFTKKLKDDDAQHKMVIPKGQIHIVSCK